MATIAELITRVEKRLNLAAGIDVQTHGEEQMLEMLRHKYNTLFDAVWWDSYMVLETFTLDGSTGLITGDVSSKIRRYIDIHSVYLNGNNKPLPRLAINSNPTLQVMEAIAPSTDTTKVFKVYPVDTSGSVHVWYRTRMTDDEWDIDTADTQTVNMDDELLILGTLYDYLIDDATNEESAAKYEKQYNARFEQLTTLAFQAGISKSSQTDAIPTQWRLS